VREVESRRFQLDRGQFLFMYLPPPTANSQYWARRSYHNPVSRGTNEMGSQAHWVWTDTENDDVHAVSCGCH
jgi:hypothetical protein